MLNPPLSHLSDDLLAFIVGHVAKLPLDDENLYNLSLTDRAFTQTCQKYLFRDLKLWNSTEISKKLTKLKGILEAKSLFANHVRMVEVVISRNESTWLFEDPTLIGIFQLLAKSPVPPHELRLAGRMSDPLIIDDPTSIVRHLMQSFFSQTLTILHVTRCTNVPLPLFLTCPRLKEVLLDQVGVTEKSYDGYPDDLCSVREAPLLEILNYRNSHSLVEHLITPPPRFNAPVVLWSKLRVLTLTPHEKEGMACLQPILDAACNTLEELYLTSISAEETPQLPLAGLVNLSNLSNLHVFALYAIINCKPPRKTQRNAPPIAVLHDINIVLRTIPESNKVMNLWFDFEIIGRSPFRGCLEQDWDGMFNEIVRISDGKPIELELQMAISTGNLETTHSGQGELYAHIIGKAESLSDHPKICVHFWNPTFWARDLAPFPPGQVRNRCRRY